MESTALRPGSIVGRYFTLNVLGSGGMGIVYSAYDPQLDRKVALKMLHRRLGPADRQLRLLAEGKALARLSHPNVVTVYDVGTHDDRLFIAMEHVVGRTLRQWIDDGDRDWREVLGLFLQAGKGLAAAHEAEIVHCDFKPENVLVSADGRVRVTDLGLARSGSDEGAAEALHELLLQSGTQAQQDQRATLRSTAIGTPAYMSPEQFAGRPAEFASDQFSFCIALYEALYRQRPFVGQSATSLAAEVQGGRLRHNRANTRVPLRIHRAVLRGLSVRPEDRFPSMAALISELEYRPRPLWPVGLALVTATVAALAFGMHWRAQRSPASCEDASRALAGVWDNAVASRVRDSLLNSGKEYAPDAWNRVQNLLDAYASSWTTSRIEACRDAQSGGQLPDVAGLRVSCLDERRVELRALTQLLISAGSSLPNNAIDAAERLTPISECDDLTSLAAGFRPPRDPDRRIEVEEVRRHLLDADVRYNAGKHREAAELATAAVARSRELGYRPLLAEALITLGRMQRRRGDGHGPEDSYQEALRIAVEQGYDKLAAKAAVSLVYMVSEAGGRHEEALKWADLGESYIAKIGGDPNLEARLLSNRGLVRVMQGDYQQGMELFQRSLNLLPQIGSKQDFARASILNRLSFVQEALDRYADALASMEKVVELEESRLGRKHVDVANFKVNWARVLIRLERFEEADRALGELVTWLEGEFGPDNFRLADSLHFLGQSELLQGEYEKATQHLGRAHGILARVYGPNHPETVDVLDDIATLESKRGNHLRAADEHRQALNIYREKLGPKHPNTLETLAEVGWDLANRGRLAEGRRLVGEALQGAEEKLGPSHSIAGVAHYLMGRVLLISGRPSDARPHLERALQISNRLVPNGALQISERTAWLGIAYLRLQQPVRALMLLEQAEPVLTRRTHDARLAGQAQLALAQSLWSSGRDQRRALSLAARARENFRSAGDGGQGEARDADNWLSTREARAQPLSLAKHRSPEDRHDETH